MVFKSNVPRLIAENSVKPYERRISPFITPGKLPILEVDLTQLATGQCRTKLPHPPKIEVSVIFVSCAVDEIEIA